MWGRGGAEGCGGSGGCSQRDSNTPNHNRKVLASLSFLSNKIPKRLQISDDLSQ